MPLKASSSVCDSNYCLLGIWEAFITEIPWKCEAVRQRGKMWTESKGDDGKCSSTTM